MRKTIVKIITLASVIGCVGQLLATTGELRTPLARFPYHYPLKPVDDGFWSLNFFGGAYSRCADKGLDSCKCTEEIPLSQLFFGKADFKAEEVFAGGSIDVAGAPAYLKYITLKPRFKYNEKGVNFGLEAERRLDDCKWSVGARMSLPFKVIELERNVCSSTMTDQVAFQQELSGEDQGLVCRKDEIFQRKNDPGATGQEVNAVVPAYRLDFLAGLCMANGRPMVEFGKNYNLSNDVGMVRIAGEDITAASAVGRTAPIAALYSENGTCPTQSFATPDEGTVLVPNGIGDLLNSHWVQDDGTIFVASGSDNRGAFISSPVENYTALGNNTVALSKLYIVPVYDSNITPITGENLRYYDRAVIIMNAVEEAISDLFEGGAAQVEQWFYNNGIHFCQTEKNIGIGDFDIDLYANYDIRENWWAKVIFGAVLPTGKKITDPGLLLAQPTGNNGHFEVKVGLQSGYKPGRWFAIHADAFYNHVFSATEWRAAAFKGATVKNIGPKIQAKTKWGYFTGHIDATFFHPENQNLGFSLGYEAYVKRCDKISFCGKCGISGLSADGTMMTELPIYGPCALGGNVLNGTAQELDPSVMAKDTKRISHKIRGEVFHRWDYCELFAGASHVIAGKNIMKESELHLGFGINW